MASENTLHSSIKMSIILIFEEYLANYYPIPKITLEMKVYSMYLICPLLY